MSTVPSLLRSFPHNRSEKWPDGYQRTGNRKRKDSPNDALHSRSSRPSSVRITCPLWQNRIHHSGLVGANIALRVRSMRFEAVSNSSNSLFTRFCPTLLPKLTFLKIFFLLCLPVVPFLSAVKSGGGFRGYGVRVGWWCRRCRRGAVRGKGGCLA